MNNTFIHNNFPSEESISNTTINSEDENTTLPSDYESTRNTRNLPLDYFQLKLVEYFNILFQQNKIV